MISYGRSANPEKRKPLHSALDDTRHTGVNSDSGPAITPAMVPEATAALEQRKAG